MIPESIRFIQHIQIIEDTKTGHKFVIDNQKVARHVTSLLNELHNENNKLKDDLEECRVRKEIIKEKLIPYHMICEKYHILSSIKLEEYIENLNRKNNELLLKINEYEEENGGGKILDDKQ